MDQKERIIEQAMHMFVSQGIKSVRMDDIAQQLGVSKRTLYELFGDKEGLLYLAMDRYFEKKRIERAAVCAHARTFSSSVTPLQPVSRTAAAARTASGLKCFRKFCFICALRPYLVVLPKPPFLSSVVSSSTVIPYSRKIPWAKPVPSFTSRRFPSRLSLVSLIWI